MGHLENPNSFFPITLCNIIYKIISSVIINRLKPILPNLISPAQTGFMRGCQIADGIIATQEIIHRTTKRPGMLIKLDLSKAYDRISWSFLFQMHNAYGFSDQWIWWVSSALFSFLINWSPSKTFSTCRGLRQGVPLSPLFILATEGLGQLIQTSCSLGHLHRLKLYGIDLPFRINNMLMMLFYMDFPQWKRDVESWKFYNFSWKHRVHWSTERRQTYSSLIAQTSIRHR